MSLTLPDFTRSAIFSARRALFTWYGSSVMTIRARPAEPSSTEATARILIEPRPVSYASRMPSRPMMTAPVGKSGPLTNFIRSFGVASGCSRWWTTASITSPRLCGGMFVAIPTAIPPEPFTSRLGKRDGRTSGCCSYPS